MSGRSTYERVGRLTVSHGDKKWDVELPTGVATIGRSYEGTTNAVNLPADDLSISRVHAEIENTGRSFILRNRSANGTLVNGRPVDQIELNSGDRVRVGSAELAFAVETVQAAQPAHPAGVRLGARVDAPAAAASAQVEPSGATEAFDSEALKRMNLSVAQQEVIAAAKASVAVPEERTAEMEAPSDAAAPKVNAGYEVRQNAAQAARAKAKAHVKAKSKEGEKTSPVVVIGGLVAMVLLLLVLLVSPSTDTGPDTIAQGQAVHADYERWLAAAAKNDPGIDPEARLDELDRRLQAIAWAERVGRSRDIRDELTVLLQLDGDSSSPVYKYAASRLPAVPSVE